MPAIVLLFCLLFSSLAWADRNCSHAYRVGISQIGYSYYLLDDGTPAGSSFDFYEELGRRSGCTFQLWPLPRMRAWHDAGMQQLDIVSPTIRTAERDRQGVFIEYFKNRNDILLDRRHGAHIDSLEQLLADPRITIGLIRGHSNGPYFDQRLAPLQAQQRIQLANTAQMLFRQLQAGRIQATIMTAGIYQKELDDLALGEQLRIIQVPESDAFSVGLYLSRLTLDQPSIDWLSLHIRAMLADGTLRRLLGRRHGKSLTERYYQPTPSPAADEAP
ncbi:substrate-binding periplasmic protein [Pseudomonas xionganensis]|nr:transporter substrate-binding domain-containing protein [Pseudomonas xionganensis]